MRGHAWKLLFLGMPSRLLKPSIPKTSLYCGLSVYIVILLFLLSRAGSTILLVICVAPGLVYGIGIGATAGVRVSDARAILFVLFCLMLNFGCVFFVTRDLLDHNPYLVLKLVTASTVSAVLFTVVYDLLLLRRFSFYRTIAMPSILGLAASVFSALFTYLLNSREYNEFVSFIIWMGMLSIFPVWQYLIGLNLFVSDQKPPGR
jgi:hypothetical protein